MCAIIGLKWATEVVLNLAHEHSCFFVNKNWYTFYICWSVLQVFNIHGDEGISREELTTMLSAIHHSTNTILSSVADSDNAVMYGENREQAVKRMVDAAFKNCDITRTGKLLPLVSQRNFMHAAAVEHCYC